VVDWGHSPFAVLFQKDEFAQLALGTVLAATGGAVKYISAVINSTERVSHRRFLTLLVANIFISAFCGVMAILLAFTVTHNWLYAGMSAGMFGYMGPQSLDWVMLALQKKIGSATPNMSAIVAVPPAADPQQP
jgi:LydA holin phage, holin superfamily III